MDESESGLVADDVFITNGRRCVNSNDFVEVSMKEPSLSLSKAPELKTMAHFFSFFSTATAV